jgi:threonine efflux protein
VDYAFFSLLMLAAQFSPGPDMLLLIRNALAHPMRAGLFTVLGIAAGLAVHLTAVLTGVALAVKESRVLFPALLLAGGTWLCWMALQLIRTRPEPPDPTAGDQRLPLSDGAAFLQGLLTNLTNAKAVLFLATVVLAWLGASPSWNRKAAAAVIILGQALLFWSLFVLALQHPVVRRGWHKTARPLHLLFGLGLLALGLGALADGLRLIAT